MCSCKSGKGNGKSEDNGSDSTVPGSELRGWSWQEGEELAAAYDSMMEAQPKYKSKPPGEKDSDAAAANPKIQEENK